MTDPEVLSGIQPVEPLHAELHPEELNMAAELPFETLLHLLSFLPSRDLLRGPRGVSHVWRDAALDATLWQHRDMSHNDSWVSAALRLVPRARSLSLPPPYVSPHVMRHAAESDCVFTELEVYVKVLSNFECYKLARKIVVRQVKTGQLRTLILNGVPDSMADLVLMAANAGLTSLSFRFDYATNRFARLPLETQRSEPSLRHLEYRGPESGHAMEAMELIVSSHRSTLETVCLAERVATRRVMELLGSCPRLREATLYTCEELIYLAGCPQLTSLTLYLDKDFSAIVPARFFKEVAKQLTKLHIPFGIFNEETIGMQMDALMALASPPGESALKELRLSSISSQETVLQLPCILRGLPHLHTLELNESIPVEALDDIHMEVAPNLRKLRLHNDRLLCRYECTHPALYRLVKRMPLLHVSGLKLFHRCRDAGTCKCCQGELHARLPRNDDGTWLRNRYLCLFREAPPDADCGLSGCSSSTCECVWVCVL